MYFDDLVIFLSLAHTQNMQQTALQLNKAPSVISKALKRLEQALAVQLFDRESKYIRLNNHGRKLQHQAVQIINKVQQTQASFNLPASQPLVIAAPAILLFRWASVLTRQFNSLNAAINFQTLFEQQALQQVLQGQADIALVTQAVLVEKPDNLQCLALGQTCMQLAAGQTHPLLTLANSSKVTSDQVLGYDFVSPSISPFCGEQRGIGCDGWHDDVFPRKLSYQVEDYAVLTQLVKSGQALAYLPDFWLRENQLVPLQVTDCNFSCIEQIFAVSYRRDLLELLN